MRKLLFLFLLVFVNTGAIAEWTALKWDHEDGGLTLYVDYTTIRKDGDKVRMLSLADFEIIEKKEINFFSSRAQNEYDCKKKEFRQIFYSLHSGSMGKGKMEHSNSEHLKWMPVKPRSMEEAMWTAACGRKI